MCLCTSLSATQTAPLLLLLLLRLTQVPAGVRSKDAIRFWSPALRRPGNRESLEAVGDLVPSLICPCLIQLEIFSPHDGDGPWQFWPIWRPDVRRTWTLFPRLTSSETGRAGTQAPLLSTRKTFNSKMTLVTFWRGINNFDFAPPPRWPRPSPTAAPFKCQFTCGQLKDPFHHTAPGPVGWPRWSRGGAGEQQVPPPRETF